MVLEDAAHLRRLGALPAQPGRTVAARQGAPDRCRRARRSGDAYFRRRLRIPLRALRPALPGAADRPALDARLRALLLRWGGPDAVSRAAAALGPVPRCGQRDPHR